MESQLEHSTTKEKKIKLAVWDLDNTLWDGTLLEGAVSLNPTAFELVKEFDRRGILQSISSKNDEELVLEKLKELNIYDYFLYPQIGWGPKANAIKTIVAELNIGMDTVAFIDDQEYEREEVSFELSEVRCYSAEQIGLLSNVESFMPDIVTEESKSRRLLYASEAKRKLADSQYEGPKESFLASLNIKFTLTRVKEEDLERAEELTVRTNQLNTTGYTYSYEELKSFVHSFQYDFYMAEMEDRFGTYGKIGLMLIEKKPQIYGIKLYLMSCRVVARGVGTIMISYMMQRAQQSGKRLLADFVENDRNRLMYMTYKFAGFQEISRQDKKVVLEHPLNEIALFPDYIQVVVNDSRQGDSL